MKRPHPGAVVVEASHTSSLHKDWTHALPDRLAVSHTIRPNQSRSRVAASTSSMQELSPVADWAVFRSWRPGPLAGPALSQISILDTIHLSVQVDVGLVDKARIAHADFPEGDQDTAHSYRGCLPAQSRANFFGGRSRSSKGSDRSCAGTTHWCQSGTNGCGRNAKISRQYR